MQIKEYEAFTLKDCLQQVRSDLGPEAVILETRKFRKGGLLGWGARDAVCIVAATGITVQNDLPSGRSGQAAQPTADTPARASDAKRPASAPKTAATASQAAAVAAARAAFSRSAAGNTSHRIERPAAAAPAARSAAKEDSQASAVPGPAPKNAVVAPGRTESGGEAERFAHLERYMREIKESLTALQREQREGQERTVTAVVSAVAPAVSAATSRTSLLDAEEIAEARFPELYQRLVEAGVSEALASDLLDSLPDFSAWSPQAQQPMAESALRDLIAHRVASAGPIALTPGQLKAVALIGPTGVGKTTTIAKLAAHFSLVERKRVALLTVDTYRIAAVEQLKTYSQIIDIPISVAYSQAEVLPAVAQYADHDLLLIDTAGRSQRNMMQVGELKTLLEAVNCETHLVLSAPVKERDMLDAAQRFSAARVDRLLFSKLDETSTYGTLLNVADRTGIPLSYLTTGQKVPEDIEIADGSKLASLLLNGA
ncbi:MAG TPA: flagellar biosynthesis protein FlhF [Chthonomonadaceae bacterium]|nr:flagellar biosynthesis protein FlhF [Chthonomonadaceae bacterium]